MDTCTFRKGYFERYFFLLTGFFYQCFFLWSLSIWDFFFRGWTGYCVFLFLSVIMIRVVLSDSKGFLDVFLGLMLYLWWKDFSGKEKRKKHDGWSTMMIFQEYVEIQTRRLGEWEVKSLVQMSKYPEPSSGSIKSS
jgi:hypothetical protein